MKHLSLLSLLLMVLGLATTAQTNTFPTTGSAGIGTISPNASSALDIVSNTKGVLVPRMTKTQRDAIASPTTGLLIFQTNSTPGFYYFSGTAWVAVSGKGANTSLSNLNASGTSINQNLTPNTTGTLDLGSITNRWDEGYINNLRFNDGTTQSTASTIYSAGTGILITGTTISNSGDINGSDDANLDLSNLSSTSVNQSLLPNVDNTRDVGSTSFSWKDAYLDGSLYLDGSRFISNPGTDNVATGIGSGAAISTGYSNAFYGNSSGNANTSGYRNTFTGYTSGYANTTGYNNSFYGNSAGYSNSTGNSNVFIGSAAGWLNTEGSDNCFIGTGTGYSNATGDENVFIGRDAGSQNTSGNLNTATGSHALYNNTTGVYNTANGSYALYSNTTGSLNTANGKDALYSNTTGHDNTANGVSALSSNTTGYENNANGVGALGSNTTGYENTANGVAALASNTTGNQNTANGYHSLYFNTTGVQNTANGYYSLLNNTIGYDNTADGFSALRSNTTGHDNTANGVSALYSNTTGHENTANGVGALNSNTTGYDNTANGVAALASNTTGNQNTANGFQSLYFNTTGNYNTANGFYSLVYNTTGYDNSANGLSALNSNTTGHDNTASGFNALFTNTTGNNNTALGSNAGVATGNLTNATVIGYTATVDASNKVRVGNSSVSSNGGQVSWSAYSDGRIKNDVKENIPGMEFIKDLRPVTFHYDVNKENELLGVKDSENWEGKYDIEKIQFTGFIAQEVDAAAQKIGYDFSGVDKSGAVLGLRYSDFVVPMVKAMQELSAMNEAKDETIKSLQSAVCSLQKEVGDLKSEIPACRSGRENSKSEMTSGFAKLETRNPKPEAILGQNIPNPFDNSTLIPFRIPKDCKDASIMITNISTSEVISVIPISCNEDHVSIDAGVLASGTYSYSLYVDGTLIQTKQMAIVR